jgi:hypothetical protein
MSNSIVGNNALSGTKPPKKIPVIGTPPTSAVRKVGTIKSKINRDTKAKLLRKFLRDGFDWRMFVPIHMAIVEELGNIELLLDGDHRKHMAIMALGDEQDVLVTLVKVKTVEEYHRLFWKMNMTNRTNVTAEEAFVHRYYSLDAGALATYKNLITAGVCIYGSSEPGGILPLNSPGPTVRRVGFDNAVKHAGVDAVKQAVDLMNKVWNNPTKLLPELLWALSLLYADYPYLSNGSKVQTDWELWAQGALGSYTQDKKAKDLKVAGGNVHHRAAESVAYAALVDYRASSLSVKGACNQKYKQKRMPTRAIQTRLNR